MRAAKYLIITSSMILAACTATPDSNGVTVTTSAAERQKLVLDNLLRSELEGVDKTEVIVSHVVIPPNTTLPKHWHPGEEFAHVLDGSVTLWQKGKRDIHFKKGDTAKVPLKQVHTAITGNEGVDLLIFRVHRQGQPERVLVE